jgi:hypothetical protein
MSSLLARSALAPSGASRSVVLDPDVQLVGAQCSGTLMMSSLVFSKVSRHVRTSSRNPGW